MMFAKSDAHFPPDDLWAALGSERLLNDGVCSLCSFPVSSLPFRFTVAVGVFRRGGSQAPRPRGEMRQRQR